MGQYDEIMADGYTKGKVIHRTKRSANKFAVESRNAGIPYRITRLTKGYRVDRLF